MNEEVQSRLVRIREFLRTDSHNLNLLAELVDLTLDAGEVAEARAAINSALAISPADTYFKSRLMLIELVQKQWGDAIDIGQGLLSDGHDDPAIHYNLGRAFLFAGSHAEAASELGPLLGVSELPADVPQLLIRALHHLGKVKEAIAVAQKHLESHPEDSAVAGMLSLLHVDNSDLPSAKVLAEKSLAAAPANLDALLALGTVQLGAEEDAPAKATFEKVIQTHGKNGRALLGLALSKLLKLDLEGAKSDFEEAGAAEPSDISTWLGLGWVQFLLRDIDAAEASFRKVVALNRYVGEAHGALAIIAVAKGKWEEADDLATTALVFDGKSFAGLLAQSLLQTRSGKGTDGQQEIDRFFREHQAVGGGTLADMIRRVAARNQSKH